MAVAERLGAPIIKAVLAVLAGSFITAGGLFSVLLGTGIEPAGAQRLIEGLALLWNILPAGLGNIVGAATLVAIPCWVVFNRSSSAPER
ncbi:MAG: hypothetical protein H0V93_11840 [Euzebyales bacterium]|nr:hypothetical protein [Euzebyales bacterium]